MTATGSSQPQAERCTSAAGAGDLFRLAACFGLVTGLLEGITRTVLQSLGGTSWNLLLNATAIKIIWFAPLLYLPVFVFIGALLAAAGRMLPRAPVQKIALFGFGLFGFIDVLSSSGRLSLLGISALSLGLTVVLMRLCSAHEAAAPKLWRRLLLCAAVATALAFGAIETGLWWQERKAIEQLPRAATGSPNVLLIVLDTLRADHLSCFGYGRATSPNIDRLAKESVFFENAYAASSWTVPSHASLLTGLYPSQHRTHWKSLDDRFVTLAEALQPRGYRTAAFSANTLLFTRAHGFGQGFLRFEDIFQSLPDMASRTFLGRHFTDSVLRRLGYDDLPGRKRAADVNRRVLAWLDHDPQIPFFVCLNYFDTHDPYTPPQPYRSKYSKEKNPGGEFNSLLSRDFPRAITPENVEGEIAAYDGATNYMDEQIGQLLSELEKRGLGKNTIVILTSDHGEMFSEHGLLGHGNALYQELVHVPLMIRWPGYTPADKRVQTTVLQTSLPATVMELIGAGHDLAFPGPSLVRTWQNPGEALDWPYPVAELAKSPPGTDRPRNPSAHGSLKAVITPQWFLIVHDRFGTSLFDRNSDPRQLNNLAKTPEGRKVASELEAYLQKSASHAEKSAETWAKGNTP